VTTGHGTEADAPRRSASTALARVVAILAALCVVTAACGGGNDSGTASSSTTEPGRELRLIAPNGLRGILRRERAASRSQETTTPPTTTAPLVPTTPYAVATMHHTFVDTSRAAPARGSSSGSGRSIATTIYYPTTTPPSSANPTPVAAPARFPLVVFAHGYAIDAASYAPLLADLAAGGFVVAAPDFPGTSTAYPGSPVRPDALQQPADISFVITSTIHLSEQPGPLFGAVDPAQVGDSGQSDGGVTAAAAAYNTCCIDARIKASVILTGGAFGFEGQWFPPGTPPVMFVHATADEVNPYGASTSMFAQAQSPKYLLTIEGGDHLQVYVDPPWEDHVSAAMVAFFDLYLKGDQTAAQRLAAAGDQPGYSLQSG
jgi:predicted dienelactone hydrolase